MPPTIHSTDVLLSFDEDDPVESMSMLLLDEPDAWQAAELLEEPQR